MLSWTRSAVGACNTPINSVEGTCSSLGTCLLSWCHVIHLRSIDLAAVPPSYCGLEALQVICDA